jgi:hypothetical protein
MESLWVDWMDWKWDKNWVD